MFLECISSWEEQQNIVRLNAINAIPETRLHPLRGAAKGTAPAPGPWRLCQHSQTGVAERVRDGAQTSCSLPKQVAEERVFLP